MRTGILPVLALGALVACGGSYSNPQPEPDYDVRVSGGANREESKELARALEATRDVLREYGWTVYRVDSSTDEWVVEARQGSDDRLRVYLSEDDGEVKVRGWRQKDGEPEPIPPSFFTDIQNRIKAGGTS